MKDLFVTGTGTDVGKTVLSAVLVAGLGGAYWKPIQTGRMGGEAKTDREAVLDWTEIDKSNAPTEAYMFDPPVSPHLAAREAGIEINLETIRKPTTSRPWLVIEGAGGVLVPINDRHFMVDLMKRLEAPVLVATQTSLGTINHTLLTVEAIRSRNIDLLGVVMIGDANLENRSAIERYGRVPIVGWIPHLPSIEHHTLRRVFEAHFDRSHFLE